jgi:hypothetical protein
MSFVAGRPTVRRAQLPGGNRMAEKRMPAVERQRETTAAGPALQLAVVDKPAGYGSCDPARKSADAAR